MMQNGSINAALISAAGRISNDHLVMNNSALTDLNRYPWRDPKHLLRLGLQDGSEHPTSTNRFVNPCTSFLSFQRPSMHFIPLSFTIALLAVYASYTSSADANGTTILTPDIDAAINTILADWNTPGGVAVAVVRMNKDGWKIENKGYGAAKVDSTKIGSDTVFNLGSNSKAPLRHPIDWSPNIERESQSADFVDDEDWSTITDLMSHRTGMPRHDFSYSISDDVPSLVSPRSFDMIRKPVSMISIYNQRWDASRYLKPSTDFRENPQYNNMMYAVLSYLPTAHLPDEPPFARYVKEHILDPLGMNSSTYSFAVANATGNLADGFARVGINVTENPVGPGTTRVLPYLTPGVTEDGDALSGPGGVLNTAVDMARWLQMLLLKGRHPITNATIIPAAVIQTVATGISVWDGNADTTEISPLLYGGAQIQSTYRAHVMIEHGGDWLGFHGQITRFPKDDFGIAGLTNDDTFGYELKEVVKFRVIDSVFGLDPVDWSTRYQVAIAAAAVTAPIAPAPPNATQPLPPTALARKYRNIGYGADIELCAVLDARRSASPTCGSLLQQLNSTFPDQIAGMDLVWDWGKLGVSYVVLKHFDGGMYNLTGWISLPIVDDPFMSVWAYDAGLDVGLTAKFDIDIGRGTVVGLGIRDGIWGSGTVEPEPTGNSVEERSEVWKRVECVESSYARNLACEKPRVILFAPS
ncbi:Beta-lactamase domain-containing protein [Mycena sanguinolenta]|uniref:Beta-lactamase domain-containing protein n=1 Tax=Mycena sanguinolenta TaxID=230812 RepID=A0A8H6XCZ9_9AGAR|nr:Beta-lactamase domain-containing protein [Mycena sanguinolenta]